MLGARVAADAGDLLDRDEDLVAGREAQLEVVAVLAVGVVAAPEHPLVAGDAVIDVDDEVAGRQPLEDVARDDAPHRLRAADPDGAEELAVRDEGEAVRAALEAAVQAPLDERDRAGRRGVRGVDDRGRDGRPRRAAPRAAAPGRWRGRSGRRPACQRSTASAIAAARAGGSCGSRQPNRSPELSPRRRERLLRRQLRLPGQLERPAGGQPALPVARAEVGRRPVLRQVAALDELGAALVGLAPEERGGLGDLAGLVDDEEGRRIEVVEAGRRRELGGPDLGRVADREGRRVGGVGRRASPSSLGSPPSNRARSAASRSGSFAAARPSRSRSAATPPWGARNSDAGRRIASLERPDGPLVGRVEGAQRVDLVAEELDPDGQGRGRREDVDEAAASRELAAAGDLGRRARSRTPGGRAAARSGRIRAPTASRRGSAGRSSGAIVCWTRAWTLATRTRAVPLRQAASAATRAAVSSATSSLRS